MSIVQNVLEQRQFILLSSLFLTRTCFCDFLHAFPLLETYTPCSLREEMSVLIQGATEECVNSNIGSRVPHLTMLIDFGLRDEYYISLRQQSMIFRIVEHSSEIQNREKVSLAFLA